MNTLSILSKDDANDRKITSELETSSVETSKYVVVNAQEEWENFLSLIKK